MDYIAEKYGRTHVFIWKCGYQDFTCGHEGGNPCCGKALHGFRKKYPGFFMAVGTHIPPNTPVENALYYNEVYEKLSRR